MEGRGRRERGGEEADSARFFNVDEERERRGVGETIDETVGGRGEDLGEVAGRGRGVGRRGREVKSEDFLGSGERNEIFSGVEGKVAVPFSERGEVGGRDGGGGGSCDGGGEG